MGFSLGTLGSTIACCFGNAFCSLCCPACPSCKGSTSTRLAYSLLLFMVLITSCTMLLPGLNDKLMEISYLCEHSPAINGTNECRNIIGSRAVYRLSLGMGIFFGFLSLLMIKVKTSANPRAKIQNGYWGFKLIILASISVAAFFIQDIHFDFVFMIFGLIGGFFFILIQLFLSIDFVQTWNESWVNHVEAGSKRHGYGLLFCTFLFYATTITGIVLLYSAYATNVANCSLNIFFILFNLCLCIILSIVSVLPRVRAHNSSCGLLQSSFVSLYIVYFTWSAMSNHPNEECIPSFMRYSSSEASFADAFTIVGLIIFVFAIIYSVLTSSRNNRTKKLFLSSTFANPGILDDAQLINSATDDKWMLSSNEENHQRVYDDETGSVTYNYSLFHLMLLFATLYIMMVLTNWYNPKEKIENYGRNSASLWVKIVASWLCVFLYIWSCIAPTVFPDRDFS